MLMQTATSCTAVSVFFMEEGHCWFNLDRRRILTCSTFATCRRTYQRVSYCRRTFLFRVFELPWHGTAAPAPSRQREFVKGPLMGSMRMLVHFVITIHAWPYVYRAR